MAVTLPNGIIFSLGTSIDGAKTVTSITNDDPAVASVSSHGYSAGNLVLLKSGWQRLNERIFRVANENSGDFELEGIKTVNQTHFPSGSSAGTVEKITGWTQITQVLESSTNGGDMQFATYSFLENDFESQIPTQASAQSLVLSIADDPTLAGYQALKELSESRLPVPLRAQLPSGSMLLYYGYVSFNETPTMNKGDVMACEATFSLMSRPTRYSA